jgi:acetyl esterase
MRRATGGRSAPTTRDEGEAYAARLSDAGVPTRLRRFAGRLHGFFTLGDLLPGHRDGLDFAVAGIARQLA